MTSAQSFSFVIILHKRLLAAQLLKHLLRMFLSGGTGVRVGDGGFVA